MLLFALFQESPGYDENVGHLGFFSGHRLAGVLLFAGQFVLKNEARKVEQESYSSTSSATSLMKTN